MDVRRVLVRSLRGHLPGTRRSLGLTLLFCLGLVGCKSRPLSVYVAPRITGFVVDAETLQPISGARVQRTSGTDADGGLQQPKGGERMLQPVPVVTGPDGAFVFESLRSLTPFRRGEWYSVPLSVSHSGYRPFSTNYTILNATNTTSGEPLIEAGQIRLIRRPQAK